MFDFLINNGLNWLFQLFEAVQGPFGGLLISLLFNLIQVAVISKLFDVIKQKDEKISDLIQDIKFLAIKTDLSPEDFAKMAENKFIGLSADTENIFKETKESVDK
jgi:hypothetical protein